LRFQKVFGLPGALASVIDFPPHPHLRKAVLDCAFYATMQEPQLTPTSATHSADDEKIGAEGEKKDVEQLVVEKSDGDEYKGQYLQGWRRTLVSLAYVNNIAASLLPTNDHADAVFACFS
jgi:hypothetical protein